MMNRSVGWLPLIGLSIGCLCPSAVWPATARQNGTPARQAAADAGSLNNVTNTPPLAPGSKGPAVVRAQILLDRVWFSPGEIDGVFSANMQRAVRGFQAARALPVNGRVDAGTWSALSAEAGPPFKPYVVSGKDMAGPYAKIPVPTAERARLKAMGYESVQENLAERFHMSPKLLSALNRGKSFKAGIELVVAATADEGPNWAAKAQSIRIDKSDRVLSVLDAQNHVLASFPVSIGGPRDPLPVGRMKITNEVKNPSFTYDPALLKTAPRSDVKAELAPGPNNPVGTVWIGLSKPHWGIHGTPYPATLGRAETNGCVHLSNWDAERVSALIKPGFPVDVRP